MKEKQRKSQSFLRLNLTGNRQSTNLSQQQPATSSPSSPSSAGSRLSNIFTKKKNVATNSSASTSSPSNRDSMGSGTLSPVLEQGNNLTFLQTAELYKMKQNDNSQGVKRVSKSRSTLFINHLKEKKDVIKKKDQTPCSPLEEWNDFHAKQGLHKSFYASNTRKEIVNYKSFDCPPLIVPRKSDCECH